LCARKNTHVLVENTNVKFGRKNMMQPLQNLKIRQYILNLCEKDKLKKGHAPSLDPCKLIPKARQDMLSSMSGFGEIEHVRFSVFLFIFYFKNPKILILGYLTEKNQFTLGSRSPDFKKSLLW